MKAKPWNRCDICGKFISKADFDSRKARRTLVTPDTAFSTETYSTLCAGCCQQEDMEYRERYGP